MLRSGSPVNVASYRRLSRRAELLIAQVLSRRGQHPPVRRALATLFAGPIGKDAVSRAWRRTRWAWEAWQQRDLAGEDTADRVPALAYCLYRYLR